MSEPTPSTMDSNLPGNVNTSKKRGGQKTKHVEDIQSTATEPAKTVNKRKPATQGGPGTKTKKTKKATTTNSAGQKSVCVPLQDVTNELGNVSAPAPTNETRQNPDDNAHALTPVANVGNGPALTPNIHTLVETHTLTPTDLEAAKAQFFKEAEERFKDLERAQKVNQPLAATAANMARTPERVVEDRQVPAAPKRQWPPIRAHKHDRGVFQNQYRNISAEKPAVPLLTAQNLEGQVEQVTGTVETIERPQGEAGDGKRGFCLQDAVDLEQNGDKYADFLARVRANATMARIDLNKTYRQQDPDLISLVCRKTAIDLPYFGKERFPGYWATREALKQYIKNQRKDAERQRKARVSGKRFLKDKRFRSGNVVYISDGEVSVEDNHGEGPSGTHHDEEVD
ncbi:hypothetical protein C8R41DRAFT_921586 [Lentinula lateritia]|uniref:Uncharacterized protein n=1 Tax=Lentinula lateritia TaxID=40482 RepID=A0ABQ8VCI0_9AGAR|nr:hypothetical protein C8R41DRAFT_921586 [Lentinula lateritia]